MKAYRLLAGAAIAITLAVAGTGAVGAHWDNDWHGPGVMGPEMMGDHMGPGMMGPGLIDPDIMGPGMSWPHPHDWWDE
jgi:hypothetical protein